jgi:hypothetical protein
MLSIPYALPALLLSLFCAHFPRKSIVEHN